jgi:hypothetical protein
VDQDYYENGVLDLTDSEGESNVCSDTWTTLAFGVPNSIDNYYFNGKIDGCKIYDVALPDAEISKIYKFGNGEGQDAVYTTAIDPDDAFTISIPTVNLTEGQNLQFDLSQDVTHYAWDPKEQTDLRVEYQDIEWWENSEESELLEMSQVWDENNLFSQNNPLKANTVLVEPMYPHGFTLINDDPILSTSQKIFATSWSLADDDWIDFRSMKGIYAEIKWNFLGYTFDDPLEDLGFKIKVTGYNGGEEVADSITTFGSFDTLEDTCGIFRVPIPTGDTEINKLCFEAQFDDEMLPYLVQKLEVELLLYGDSSRLDSDWTARNNDNSYLQLYDYNKSGGADWINLDIVQWSHLLTGIMPVEFQLTNDTDRTLASYGFTFGETTDFKNTQ